MNNKTYKSVLEMIWYMKISLRFKLRVTIRIWKNKFLRLFKKG